MIIVAIANIEKECLYQIVDTSTKCNVDLKIIPNGLDKNLHDELFSQVRNVNPADLLGRNAVSIDKEFVDKKIKEVLDLKIPIDIIATSHGVIWRDNPTQIVEKYLTWANNYQENQITILYGTMWDGTKRMAAAITKGIREIEKKINKTFIKAEIPTGKEVCKKQLFHLIDKMEKVEVDHEQINDFLPEIYSKLEWLDKEDLIKRFVSLEFNRFLEYYKNAPDLNIPDEKDFRQNEKDKGKRSFYYCFII